MAEKYQLPPKALMLIGVAIIIASVAMNMSHGYQRFTIFIVAGVIVFAYGLVKLFLDKRNKPKQPVHNTLTPQQHMHHNRQPEHNKPKRHFCPYCAAPVQPHARYCGNCGNQVVGL